MDRRAHNQAYIESLLKARLFQGPDGRYYTNHPGFNGIIQVESSGNPNAKAATSSATGLLQFIESTGRKYGLVGKGFDRRRDPYANFRAGIQYAVDNAKALDAAGHWLDDGVVYLAHQQGLGGAQQILGGKVSAKIRRNIDNNGGRGKTPAQFREYWANKIRQRGSKSIPQGAQLVDVPQHNQAAASAGLADVMGNYQNNAAVAQTQAPQATAIRSVVPEGMNTQIGQVLPPAWAKVTGWNESPGDFFGDDILGEDVAATLAQVRPQDLWTVTPHYAKRIV